MFQGLLLGEQSLKKTGRAQDDLVGIEIENEATADFDLNPNWNWRDLLETKRKLKFNRISLWLSGRVIRGTNETSIALRTSVRI